MPASEAMGRSLDAVSAKEFHCGALRAGAVRGPGAFTINMNLARWFRIHEAQILEVRGEAFNLLNWTNSYNPVTGFTAANFGQIVAATSSGLGALSQALNDRRIMQFAMKYNF
jgi:hypothetical protein